MSRQDLTKNLKLLCSYAPSISTVCRDLDINRQQFTKYLNGSSFPSPRNMRLICDYFGVEEEELLLPTAQFASILSITPKTQSLVRALGPAASHINEMLGRSTTGMQHYAGYYYYYYFSPTRPGKVRKSLLRIHEHRDIFYTRLVERIQPSASPLNRSHFSHYLGVALMLADRIFIVDHEADNLSAVSQTILLPSHRTELKFLSGMTLGVQGKSARSPFAARVFLERIEHPKSMFELLRQTGLFERDDPDLPKFLGSILGIPEMTHGDALIAYELLN
ncbi:helix-turn-helix domain-containing protein [Nitrincola alkalilacustris]|uniref:helix-turn-helix domain-containing protein n=1 Tax=Nitrincola alkalilacustris TaxID=1571224 RepID=UPI00124EA79D|nr:helix-turn-helix transcriptional regulator [Nitrincola alkalilacustris]